MADLSSCWRATEAVSADLSAILTSSVILDVHHWEGLKTKTYKNYEKKNCEFSIYITVFAIQTFMENQKKAE